MRLRNLTHTIAYNETMPFKVKLSKGFKEWLLNIL